jgi:hypothetical protein
MLPHRDAPTNLVADIRSRDSQGYGEACKPGIEADGSPGANLTKRGKLEASSWGSSNHGPGCRSFSIQGEENCE